MRKMICLLVMCLLVSSIIVYADEEPQDPRGPFYIPKEVTVDEKGNIVIIDPTDIGTEGPPPEPNISCEDEAGNKIDCYSDKPEDDAALSSYDPNKKYTLYSFPVYAEESYEDYKQRFREYFGFSLTEEENQQLHWVRSKLGIVKDELRFAEDKIIFEPNPEVGHSQERIDDINNVIETYEALLEKVEQRKIQGITEPADIQGVSEPMDTKISANQETGGIQQESNKEQDITKEAAEKKPIFNRIIDFFKSLFWWRE